MKQILCPTLLFAVSISTMVTSHIAAQELDKIADEESLTPKEQKELAEYRAAMSALQDPAFERFVPVSDLRLGYDNLDVEALADCALQLAHGESVLLRGHRSGIAPSDLLQLALQVAATRRETESFDRLRQVSKHLDLPDVIQALDASSKLASQPRATQTDLGEHQSLYDVIEGVALHRDATRLDALRRELPDELNDRQRAAVDQAVQQAKQQIESTKPIQALEALAAPSRFFESIYILSVSPPVLTEGQGVIVKIRAFERGSNAYEFTLWGRPAHIDPVTREVGRATNYPWRESYHERYLGTRVRQISRTTDMQLNVRMSRVHRGRLYEVATQRKTVRVVSVPN